MYNYYPYQTNYSNLSQSNQDERIWVQNEMSADAYLIAPNGFVRLWDANKNRFYEKRADATGRPYPLEVYEYKKIDASSALQVAGQGIDYSKEIEGLMRRIEALEEALNEQSNADDTRVQQIQSELSGKCKTRSRKADSAGEDISATA